MQDCVTGASIAAAVTALDLDTFNALPPDPTLPPVFAATTARDDDAVAVAEEPEIRDRWWWNDDW